MSEYGSRIATSCQCSAASELIVPGGMVSVFQVPGLEFGAALAGKLAGRVEAVFELAIEVVAVLLRAELGGEDEGLGVVGFGRIAFPRD